MIRVAILGSTGSIGTQALDVIARHPDRFKVVGLAAGRNVELLREQVKRFSPELATTAEDGAQGLMRVATESNADIVLAATDGAVAFDAVFEAVRRGTNVAVANKELIVAAGELFMAEAKKSGAQILPVDSEHSAIFQCLVGEDPRAIASIILTASGGPFWRKSKAELDTVTLKEALAHPTWQMGTKNTVDSATMMNKGLEIIEASRLFDVDADRLQIAVHPQSIAHGFVVFTDGSVKGQLCAPDMRIPIGYALSYPERLHCHPEVLREAKPRRTALDDLGAKLEATELRYDFEPPDTDRFPCVRLAYEALRAGGTAPAVLSAANEVAVNAFVEGRIGFTRIAEVIGYVLGAVEHQESTLETHPCCRPGRPRRSNSTNQGRNHIVFSILALISLASIGKTLTFLMMLSVLVVLHEYGHFFIARRNGVRVNEFAVGMGPKLAGWTSPRSGTLYSLRLLPIGGYCAMEGEDGKTTEAEQQREFREGAAVQPTSSVNFQSKSTWARLAIVLAGPVANFILAFVILLIGAFTFGVATADAPPVVALVTANSPAAHGGVLTGDQIIAIDGAKITSSEQAVNTFHKSLGKALRVTLAHSGVQRTLDLTPAPCPASTGVKLGCIGIMPSPGYVHESFIATIRDASLQYGFIADNTVSSIGLLVTRFTQYAGQVSGVVGMGQVATTIQDIGWGPYFGLAAAISFALGLFNLLPIPALDGGRAAFIIAEMLRGKPVDPEKEALVHLAGFAALIGLMIVVAFHDIAKIASGQGVF